MSAGQFTTEAYQDLLEHVNLIVQRPATSKHKLVVLSQQVAQGVTKIVQAAETIKGMRWAALGAGARGWGLGPWAGNAGGVTWWAMRCQVGL